MGRWMLRQLLEEQHARGVPLLSLYPTTTAFYRRVGFERAAQRLIYELPLAAIDLHDYGLEAAPVAARGYPPGVAAELHLKVGDDLRPWNKGRFVLRVADGVGGPEQMTGSREGSGTEPVQRQRR